MLTNAAAVVSKKVVPLLFPAILICVLASRACATTAGPKRVEPERLPLHFEALGARDGTPGFVARGNRYTAAGHGIETAGSGMWAPGRTQRERLAPRRSPAAK